MRAIKLVQEGLEFNEIVRQLKQDVEDTKIFFCVDTLEYLRKGGRIGLITSVLGTVLNLKPIISCNENGVYYTAAKERGRKKSIATAIKLAQKFAGQGEYHLAVAHGGAQQEAGEILQKAKKSYFRALKRF